MSRNPRLYLEDIQQGCAKVLRFTAGHLVNSSNDNVDLVQLIEELEVSNEHLQCYHN